MPHLRYQCWIFMLVIGLLALSATGAIADEPGAPAVTVSIVSPAARAVVGGEGVNIENHVTHAAGISISAVETEIAEIGTPALTLSIGGETWQAKYNGEFSSYPETWDTRPMHNGECRLTTLAVCQQGDKRFVFTSKPVTVTVKNLWITGTSPALAFFALKGGESQTITVDFDHYQAAGPYRVEYSFRRPGIDEVFRSIVHEHVTAHHDTCTFTADKETLPWGAYVCFDIKVSRDNDAATLLSPTLKIIQEGAELLHNGQVRLVYTLSDPPGPGGLTILCYSDLHLVASQTGLREQCRDWEHAVVLPFAVAGFRSVYTGMDNHTDNRGRAPQPMMPES